MLSLYSDLRFFNHVEIQMDYVTLFHNQDIFPLPVDHFHILYFKNCSPCFVFMCNMLSPPVRSTLPRKAEAR